MAEVQISWCPGRSGDSRWRTTIGPDDGEPGSGRPAARPPQASPPAAVDRSWTSYLARRLSRALGAEAWSSVSELWDPVSCDIVVELADVLDDVWARVIPASPTGSCIRIQLFGIPGVVPAVLAAVSAGPLPLRSGSGGRALRPTALLRALGPTLCIASGHGSLCSAATELGTISAPLDVRALASSSARDALDALGGRATVQHVAALLRGGRLEVATGGLISSVDHIRAGGLAPHTAARFGER